MNFQGITHRWKPLFDELKNLPYQYQPRLKVEEDPAYTQILTYVMVARHGHLLTFRRGAVEPDGDGKLKRICLFFA